jgi:hypothetical protein
LAELTRGRDLAGKLEKNVAIISRKSDQLTSAANAVEEAFLMQMTNQRGDWNREAMDRIKQLPAGGGILRSIIISDQEEATQSLMNIGYSQEEARRIVETLVKPIE